MIPSVDSKDWSTMLHLSGAVFFFLGLVLFIPVIVALFAAEWKSMVDFFFTASLLITIGSLFHFSFKAKKDANWLHGMCTSAFSWLLSMLILAIPYYLSGYFLSYTDCCFDVMSGMTTTGLILIQNIDHLPISLNIWRHILTFIGGQGIVIIAIAFIPSIGLNYKAMVGEGKEERLMPSVKLTGRYIWIISLVYLFIGTLVLFIIGLFLGLNPGWSLFHGLNMFMSAWSTGGFGPQSLNAFYYHSLPYEIALTVISILGSMNFGLHYYVWFKRRKALVEDIETKSFMVTFTVLFLIFAYVLMKQNIYPTFIGMFRKIIFNLVSGHTTTGTQTIYTIQFTNLWHPIIQICLIIAMAIGGSSASTAGGFKGLRMGIIFKSIVYDIKQFFMPTTSVVSRQFEHIGKQIMNDKVVKSAMTIVLLYVFLYGFGAILGIMYGYPVNQALFDSVSAGSNTGLSAGLTSISMPFLMKLYYIFSMFLGRIEFIAGFVLFAFLFRNIAQLVNK